MALNVGRWKNVTRVREGFSKLLSAWTRPVSSGPATPSGFFRALFTEWGPAMSGPLSVPFAFIAAFWESTSGKLAFGAMAFVCVWYAAYKVWQLERKKVLGYEDALRPKIALTGIIPHEQLIKDGSSYYTFDLKITNCATALENCLVKIDEIVPTDGSIVKTHHLPHSLRTARNNEREGGGPFHMRANESKVVQLCARGGGAQAEWSIFYEPGANIPSMKGTSECDLVIGIYSEAMPTKARVQLRVDHGGGPTVTLG